jgi:hypothetical protein
VPCFVGFTVRVADLRRTIAVLQTNGVAFRDDGPTITVDAHYGCGSTVTFTQEAFPGVDEQP